MINYSRQEFEQQLVADQALWRRVPIAAGALLWPSEVALLGWDPGWWIGALTVVLAATTSATIPPRLKVSLYLIDLLEQAVRLPLDLCWLLLAWHLWLREPLFPLFGQPVAGALLMALSLRTLTRLLSWVVRFLAGRASARGQL